MTMQAPPRLRPGSKERSLPQAAREVDVERLSLDTIRRLALDAEGPSTPMALAPLVHVLFTRYLKHDPGDSGWADRDRLVLSADHASALLDAALQLTGYDLPPDELRLGPLSQGVANAVRMALAERLLADRFNRPRHEIINHHTWGFASDGDLLERATDEAAARAGQLRLGKLVVFLDDNRTPEGSTDLAFSESVSRRFNAYGWQILTVDDANDVDSLAGAIEAARADDARPSLVVVRTTIASGAAPARQRTVATHGAPPGQSEIDGTKGEQERPVAVPGAVRAAMARVRARGERRHQEWEVELLRYQQDRPDLAAELERVLAGELPAGWEEAPAFDPRPVKAALHSGF